MMCARSNCQIRGDRAGQTVKFAEVAHIREFCDSQEKFTAVVMKVDACKHCSG